MALVAGIDIGGTNIEGALVDDAHEVVDRDKRPTPTGREATGAYYLSVTRRERKCSRRSSGRWTSGHRRSAWASPDRSAAVWSRGGRT